MGLFNFIKGELIEVIEWTSEDRDTLLWKFPDEDKNIKMGAQLTVREGQVALFLNEGQLADVYGPGRHELVTRNMPVMSSLRAWSSGFDSPFKADVYFINTRTFTNMKWGTKQPIMVNDPDFQLVQLRAFGTFNFRISEPASFFRQFAGTGSQLSSQQLLEDMRSVVITEFSTALKKSGKSLVEINARANELGGELLPLVADDFAELGIEVTQLYVESVSLPPEIQKELTEQDLEYRRKKREGTLENELEMQNLAGKANLSQNVDDMQKYMQFQAGSSMNPQGGPNEGEGQASNMMNDMMQMGMGMNMANQMMQGMNQQQGQQGQQPNQGGGQQGQQQEMTREEVMNTLKQLGELKEAGVLTEEEFNTKKQDLLSRL